MSTLKGFAESLGLVNAIVKKHGSTQWTYATDRTAPDHILVSKKLVDDVQAVGVWQGRNVCDSDHRPMAIKIHTDGWLRIPTEEVRATAPQRKHIPQVTIAFEE